jgi:hypothetical protein
MSYTNSWSAIAGLFNQGNIRTGSVMQRSMSLNGDMVLAVNIQPSVILSRYTADCNGDAIMIRWSSARELNNAFYTVERSDDGALFYPIRTVTGGGFTAGFTNYSISDRNVTAGTIYYRLKQTDFDGSFSYLNTISTSCDLSSQSNPVITDIGPNPFTSEINIRYSSPIPSSLRLYNSSGQLVHSEQIPLSKDTQQITITDLDVLPAGLYYLKTISSGKSETRKLIKQ